MSDAVADTDIASALRQLDNTWAQAIEKARAVIDAEVGSGLAGRVRVERLMRERVREVQREMASTTAALVKIIGTLETCVERHATQLAGLKQQVGMLEPLNRAVESDLQQASDARGRAIALDGSIGRAVQAS